MDRKIILFALTLLIAASAVTCQGNFQVPINNYLYAIQEDGSLVPVATIDSLFEPRWVQFIQSTK